MTTGMSRVFSSALSWGQNLLAPEIRQVEIEQDEVRAMFPGQLEAQLPHHGRQQGDRRPAFEEALDELADAPPDLVVLDFHMPGGGGPAVLDKIRGDPGLADTPVLLVSGTLESLDRDWAEKVGADEHLSKPFPVETFKETVRGLLNRRGHS
jgi:CheY-like chemotaxis protein